VTPRVAVRVRNAAVVVAVLAASAVPTHAADWRQVTGPPELELPRDHGAHPDVRTEWWYLTANLTDGSGHRYGVQVTFFRQGLDPTPPEAGDSPLRARHAVAAHVAIADVDGERFLHAERVRRADGAFAGFATDDLRVWLGDWTLERGEDGVITARAADRAVGIAVELGYATDRPSGSSGRARPATRRRAPTPVMRRRT